MENLLQKFCLTLVGVFSILNFSTYPQGSARNAAINVTPHIPHEGKSGDL